VQNTIANLIEAAEGPTAALIDAEKTVLSYSSLSTHMNTSIEGLNRLGLGRGDRIAVVLPNGPTMASAFVTIASGATIAPLNPSYRYDEFVFYLKDLEAQAVVLMSGEGGEARQAAQSLSIPILELMPINGTAGLFELDGAGINRHIKAGPAEPDDAALILHTSGTTSRPKIVPLTHANLCVSA
ncbi:uncharacterized protein METZ01_LOCUS479531, partial [marine metagenome]